SGLLPALGLYLIDLTSPADLSKGIADARTRGIYIFNFSFALENDPSLDSLLNKMQRSWTDLLFVVAAGNDGKKLTSASEIDAPVRWVDQVPNQIVVGAADHSAHVLGEWAPDPKQPDKRMPGSNFGKQYVHIIAPGLQIFSTVKNNGYAKATGS